MITEDYVSFETAKLLKEKGFDWQVDAIYAETKVLIKDRNTRYSFLVKPNDFFHLDYGNYKAGGKAIKCPSLAMAMKWLREVHKIIITMDYDEYELEKTDNKQIGYGWNIQKIENPTKYLKISEHVFDTYEESCEDSLKYCLSNLI